MIHREWILQKHVRLWVREALDCPHKFVAFDRGKASGEWTHMYEKQRGIEAATADTLLMIDGHPDIWCECKRPGWKPLPSDEHFKNQQIWGDEVMALGRAWFWTTSVDHYFKFLARSGISMHRNAGFLALHHDAGVESEIASAEKKTPKSYKPRKMPVSASRIAKARKAGVLV